jgi:nitric oxide reductase activation protein
VSQALEDAEDWDQDWDDEPVEGESADHDQTGEVDDYEWERDDDAVPDIDEVDALEDAYDRLQAEQDRTDTDLAQDERDRDERLADGEHADPDLDVYHQAGSEVVRQHVEESGQAQAVIDFFRSLKTQDRRIPSDAGGEMNDGAVLDLIAGDGSATNRMYLRKQKAETGDRVVGVTMDHSGSMRGVVKEAKSALGLLAMACEEIGDEFVANAFLSHEKRGKEHIDVQMITGPGEDFEWSQMDSTWPVYQDPITPGMRHAKWMMDQETAREEVLFVITDGQPMITSDGKYNSPDAIQEAQDEVRELRHNGTKVIGIGIAPGVDAKQMEEMFGEGGFVVAEVNEIADRLIEAYRTQMKVESGR